MAGHILESRQRNPKHSVGWGVGRFQNAGDYVFVLVLLLGIKVEAMVRLEGVTRLQPQALGDERPHHRLAIAVFEPAPTGHQPKTPPRSRLSLGEEVGQRTHNAITQIIITDRDRNRQSHQPVGGQRLKIGKRDIPGRSLQVEKSIKHQLQLRPAGPQDGIPRTCLPSEGRTSLTFDHPD